MFKKIMIPLFVFCLFLNAEDSNQTIDDKFASCEKAYDQCVTICEDKDSKVDECVSTCDEALYNCNSKVEEEIEKPAE